MGYDYTEHNVTWRDVVFKHPEVMQTYVQERGPLPEGPIVRKDWETFVSWLSEK